MELIDRSEIVVKMLAFEPHDENQIVADEMVIKLWENKQRQKAARYRVEVAEAGYEQH